jgi:hypothetical protein
MTKSRKKLIWEYRFYFTIIFLVSLPVALFTCIRSLIKGKIENNMFSKAWANAKTITPMIFS